MERILSMLPASQLHLATGVQSVRTRHGKNSEVELTTASGETSKYDHVIFACHSDAALNILRAGGTVTHEEERILGTFEWNRNAAVLHYDKAVSVLSASVVCGMLLNGSMISSCHKGALPGHAGTTSPNPRQRRRGTNIQTLTASLCQCS